MTFKYLPQTGNHTSCLQHSMSDNNKSISQYSDMVPDAQPAQMQVGELKTKPIMKAYRWPMQKKCSHTMVISKTKFVLQAVYFLVRFQ